MNTARKLRALALCTGVVVAAVAAAPAYARAPAPDIKVLSNRADLVSGGDAFVRVTLPRHDGGRPMGRPPVSHRIR